MSASPARLTAKHSAVATRLSRGLAIEIVSHSSMMRGLPASDASISDTARSVASSSCSSAATALLCVAWPLPALKRRSSFASVSSIRESERTSRRLQLNSTISRTPMPPSPRTSPLPRNIVANACRALSDRGSAQLSAGFLMRRRRRIRRITSSSLKRSRCTGSSGGYSGSCEVRMRSDVSSVAPEHDARSSVYGESTHIPVSKVKVHRH
eukprot:1634064-Pleurochrysis_carterae.AAC.4